MNTSTRWTVAVLAVVVALAVGLWAQLDRNESSGEPGQVPARAHRDADTPQALAEPRARADLAPCPADGPGAGPPKLHGITVECAGDGADVDVAKALAGRTVVLNLWAYWCAPCAKELPAMAEYQQRVGPAVTVVTVHQDENETAALLRLAELGVRLPIRDIGLPDEGDHLAADAALRGLAARDKPGRGGHGGGAEPAEDARQGVLARVDPAAGARDALQAGDHALAVAAELELDDERRVRGPRRRGSP